MHKCINRLPMSNTIPSSSVEPPIPPPSYENSRRTSSNREKVLIVHGHEELPKVQLANFLYEKGFEPIILHQQPNGGRTLIEKLEKGSSDVRYAFILLTPEDRCDGHLRARQNVILELGFFWGTLGRDRVCCLSKGEVQLPSDMHGIALIQFKERFEEIYYSIEVELRNAGYNI